MTRLGRTISLAALLLALVVPAAARADSLVFNMPDGNVWLATPDGSGLHQVTLDGTPGNPYGAPSQADDGTIVTTFGSGANEQIIRMKQNGEVLSSFKPAVEFQLGVLDAEVSPDGTLVAYWTGYFGNGTCDPGSTGTTPCMVTEVTSATAPIDMGAGLVARINPSWASGSRLVTAGRNFGLYTWDLGDPSEHAWFDAGGPNDPELSRDGSRLAHTATATFTGQERLGVRETSGDPRTDEPGPGAPGGGCELIGPAGGQFDDPTWSPDGTAVAWEEGDGNSATAPAPGEGIWVWELGSGPIGCSGIPSEPAIPGGTDPDWGPAAVNPGPRSAPQPPGPPPPQPPVPCCAPPQPSRDLTAPALELSLGSRRFAAASRGSGIAQAIRADVGTRVRYVLDEAATVTFTVERQADGRRVGRRCAKPTRRNRRRPSCVRYVRVGSFVHSGRAGANPFKFTGRVRGRKLRPGRHRLVAIARDAAGNASTPSRATFTIVRR